MDNFTYKKRQFVILGLKSFRKFDAREYFVESVTRE